jgi:hypothetical protein
VTNRSFPRHARALLLATAATVFAVAPLAAQEPPVTPITAPPVAADTLDQTFGPSPRGAFLRSLALPGWGQLYVGTPVRAGVYIGLQATSYAMLVQSIRRLEQIRDDEVVRAAPVRQAILREAQTDTALSRRIQDPFVLDDLIGADPDVASARALVRARTRHRQDWITYTIVFTMASAIDAYVSAHLSDFPGTITAEPRGAGGVSLQLSVPAGRVQR